MEPMRIGLLGACTLSLVLAGCVGPTKRIPEPTPEMALALGVHHQELVRGHRTYMAYCNRCHERVPPGAIDPEYWRGIVPHMALRSKISRIEESELMLYVLAAHGTAHGLNLQH